MKHLMMVLVLAVAAPQAAVAAGDADRGQMRFKLCAACHTADAATNRMGPYLKGVFGRQAGSVEGFNYSDAMKAKGAEGLVWDGANIDAYLADPKGFIPNNRMAVAGVKKPEDRADIIAYLKTKM